MKKPMHPFAAMCRRMTAGLMIAIPDGVTVTPPTDAAAAWDQVVANIPRIYRAGRVKRKLALSDAYPAVWGRSCMAAKEVGTDYLPSFGELIAYWAKYHMRRPIRGEFLVIYSSQPAAGYTLQMLTDIVNGNNKHGRDYTAQAMYISYVDADNYLFHDFVHDVDTTIPWTADVSLLDLADNFIKGQY